jgi:hypothetical protein
LRPYLIKTHHKKKGWWSGSSSNSICLASMRPEFKLQCPPPPKRIMGVVTPISCIGSRKYSFPSLLPTLSCYTKMSPC